jgi:hypothetical protein
MATGTVQTKEGQQENHKNTADILHVQYVIVHCLTLKVHKHEII